MSAREKIVSGIQLQTDGVTVWVNGPDGMCLARFGRLGIDVHATSQEQSAGKVCHDCTHGTPGPREWDRFRESTRTHHGVRVPTTWRPAWISAAD